MDIGDIKGGCMVSWGPISEQLIRMTKIELCNLHKFGHSPTDKSIYI